MLIVRLTSQFFISEDYKLCDFTAILSGYMIYLLSSDKNCYWTSFETFYTPYNSSQRRCLYITINWKVPPPWITIWHRLRDIRSIHYISSYHQSFICFICNIVSNLFMRKETIKTRSVFLEMDNHAFAINLSSSCCCGL